MLTKIILILFSPGPLHGYSGAVKKDHLTIKDHYVHVYFTTLVLISVYANLDVSSQTCKYW